MTHVDQQVVAAGVPVDPGEALVEIAAIGKAIQGFVLGPEKPAIFRSK
jgi:hypothetical protein